MGAIGDALALAGAMAWQILWALILGFTLSAVIHAVISNPRSCGYWVMIVPHSCRGIWVGSGILSVLLRGGGVDPVAVRQGCELFRGWHSSRCFGY